MGNFKINMVVVLITMWGVISCSEKNAEMVTEVKTMVSKAKYDAMVSEYQELNRHQERIINDNLEKGKIINQIVGELRNIAGTTRSLRINIENGTGRLTQAEEIDKHLKQLKKQLEQMHLKDNANQELIKTIENLKNLVEEKELEIIDLKNEINQQAEVIREQNSTIRQQDVEIEQKNYELATYQSVMWYTLGQELLGVSEILPVTRGRKDKRNMKNTKYFILNKAKECFEQAAKLGHAKGEASATQVNYKMKRL